MKRIWAPWRKAYILGKKPKSGCFFCTDIKAPRRKDQKNLLLYRGRYTFIVMNRYPYTNAHLMIVPYRHVESLEKLNDKEKLELLDLLTRSQKLLIKVFKPQGFNIGINIGKAAGAGIPHHIHLHIVPRWLGDTNFMPVTTGAKVISDSLDSTYQHLQRVLRTLK